MPNRSPSASSKPLFWHFGEAKRPIEYLESPKTSKEELAKEIAAKDGIREGPICLLTSVEVCSGYDVSFNGAQQRLQLVARPRKCLHLYLYQIDPVFGFMHTRLQTWFPFNIHICLNGRECLAGQMDATVTPRKVALLYKPDLQPDEHLLYTLEEQLRAVGHEVFAGLPGTDHLNRLLVAVSHLEGVQHAVRGLLDASMAYDQPAYYRLLAAGIIRQAQDRRILFRCDLRLPNV